jgi:hypothetical protein
MKTDKTLKWGEHIGGSRYDKARSRLTVKDLVDMNSREREKYVCKDNIWPKPNYAEMVKSGMPAETCWLIKRVRDAIPSTPTQPELQSLYITAVEKIFEMVSDVECNEGMDVLRNKIDTWISDPQNFGVTDRSSWPQTQLNVHRLLGSRKFFSACDVTRYAVMEAHRHVSETDWPLAESWRRGIKTIRRHDGWHITKSGKYLSDKPFADITACNQYLETVLKPKVINTKKQESKDNWDRPVLDDIVRTGTDYRKGKDVTPNDLIKTFGFRGVETGKWNQKDLQVYVNHAYDALMDFSSILNIPPETIALGGSLGLAFGARGSGPFGAHYEPARAVINLTKTRGAGALAHEYAHALDDFLGRMDGHEKLGSYASQGLYGNKISPKIRAQFATVMETILKRPQTLEEAIAETRKRVVKIQGNIKGWLRYIAADRFSTEEITAWADAVLSQKINADHIIADVKQRTGKAPNKKDREGLRANISGLFSSQKRLSELESGKAQPTGSVPTNFYSVAVEYSKGRPDAYWTRKQELFARAFEAYIEDRIEAANRKSQYLVHGTDGPAYPQEKERVSFADSISQLTMDVEPILISNRAPAKGLKLSL